MLQDKYRVAGNTYLWIISAGWYQILSQFVLTGLVTVMAQWRFFKWKSVQKNLMNKRKTDNNVSLFRVLWCGMCADIFTQLCLKSNVAKFIFSWKRHSGHGYKTMMTQGFWQLQRSVSEALPTVNDRQVFIISMRFLKPNQEVGSPPNMTDIRIN